MGFTYYRQLTIDHTKCGAADSSNFAVLVNGSNAILKDVAHSGHINSSTGADILFFSDSALTTQIASEIDFYDNINGILQVWVKIGTVSHTVDTIFYIAYGNSSPPARTTNPWDANYISIYHLGNGTSLSATDSVGANNGTLVNTPTATTGKIDGAANFASASSQYITATGIDPSAITFSGWVNPTSLAGAYAQVFGRDNAGNNNYTSVLVKNGGKLALYIHTVSAIVDYDGIGLGTLSLGTWAYVVMTYSSTDGLRGYINGSQDGTAAANGLPTTAATTFFIANDTVGGRFFDGKVDEVRASNIVRPVDWILTEYNNQNAPGDIGAANFLTWGTEIVVPSIINRRTFGGLGTRIGSRQSR